MAYLVQPDFVKYLCTCGQLKPITSLYFCRHCLKIRCGFCICHEVDSHYCANCLENMPSSEARLKKNCCSSCFDCPSCFHTLSTRATHVQPRPLESAGGDTKLENKQTKKMYYLSCFNCRWTSRDVGIPDQPVATGSWPEQINPFATRFNQLVEYYKAIAQQEKQEKLEKERKKFTIRGKYITLTDKTGLTSATARSLAGLGGESTPATRFEPSKPTEEVPGLPEDIYTKEVDLNAVTSVQQRLAAPARQPSATARLHPLPRALVVKRSQRCRACDHNLTKPEYNPGSVKFKIELLAFYHVPEIKIISCEPLRAGAESTLLLKISNPTAYEMQLKLLQPEDIPADEENTITEKEVSLPARGGPLLGNARAVTPDVTLTLSQRDDAAEYDDEAQHPDQHEMIIWRKANKMSVRITVSVSDEATPPAAVILPLALQYSYRSLVPAGAAPRPNQPLQHTLHALVTLHLGHLAH